MREHMYVVINGSDERMPCRLVADGLDELYDWELEVRTGSDVLLNAIGGDRLAVRVVLVPGVEFTSSAIVSSLDRREGEPDVGRLMGAAEIQPCPMP